MREEGARGSHGGAEARACSVDVRLSWPLRAGRGGLLGSRTEFKHGGIKVGGEGKETKCVPQAGPCRQKGPARAGPHKRRQQAALAGTPRRRAAAPAAAAASVVSCWGELRPGHVVYCPPGPSREGLVGARAGELQAPRPGVRPAPRGDSPPRGKQLGSPSPHGSSGNSSSRWTRCRTMRYLRYRRGARGSLEVHACEVLHGSRRLAARRLRAAGSRLQHESNGTQAQRQAALTSGWRACQR